MNKETNKGFTILELIIVVGLIGVAAAFSVMLGVDAIVRGSVQSERDYIVSSLQAARAQALANVDEVAHGVRIDTDEVIFFDATSCVEIVGSDRRADRAAAVEVSPDPVEVIFDQVSGNVTCMTPPTITLTESVESSVIEINSEGRIEW